MKQRILKTARSLLLLAVMLSLGACGGGLDLSSDTVTVPPRFDFRTEDLSPFIDMTGKAWRDSTLTVEDVAPVTEADAKAELNAQLKSYYPAAADRTATVKNGDTLYLYYMGITKDALNEALAAGKISTLDCAGMSYFDIQKLGINFEGGTTSSLLGLKVGSAGYIDGFESGLVGVLPSEYGEDNPLRLHLAFPASYGSAELAGKEVIFFCRLFYVGDTTKAALTADTVTPEELNAILGFTGTSAYPDVASCLVNVKRDLEAAREEELYANKETALHEMLVTLATYKQTPDAALDHYVFNWLSEIMEQVKRMYQESPATYQYYFGDGEPNLGAVITYYGYSADKCLEEMREDALPIIRRQLAFWCVVRAEGMTLSDAEIAAARAEYIGKYGASVFDGVDEATIYEQFLYDKFTEMAIAHFEEMNAITYTELQSE